MQIKIDDSIYESIRKIAEKSNRSIKDVVEEALKVYILGAESIDKDVKDVKHRWISVQYRSFCRKCGKQLNVNDIAFYVRYTYSDGSSKSFIYCPECFYPDSALAKLYLKKKELESIIRGLKKEANRLADEINKLKTEEDVLKIKSEILAFWRNFRESFSYDPNISRIDEFMDKLDELINKISSLEQIVTNISARRKKDYIKMKQHL
ncbi:MAG: ribbon-helix-helix protein, CopG family [Ignisphaera sp.]